ncbi:hypothetical protein TNCV_2965851 [Trichonephila clavipes]|nr:hypothetical protein TNCV_2965851 [Trichonephila clavipes]
MALYRSPLTVTLWPSSFLKKYGPMIPPAHKAHQTVSFSGCNGCELASLQMRQFCLLTKPFNQKCASSLDKIRL